MTNERVHATLLAPLGAVREIAARNATAASARPSSHFPSVAEGVVGDAPPPEARSSAQRRVHGSVGVIVVDTGPIVALLNDRDSHHQRCREFLTGYPGPLLVTAPVFTEVLPTH
jgi:hypothetical protein